MREVMKILLLNPQIDAEHQIARALQKRGVAVLFPADSTEAWQMLRLHGSSVDLAIVHREGLGSTEPGCELLAKLKKDAKQSDLPVILTSDKWGDAEFAKHQDSPAGANAYLKAPFGTDGFFSLIDGVLGEGWGKPAAAPSKPSAKAEAAAKAPAGPPTTTPTKREETTSTGELILEDVSALFMAPEVYEPSDTSIRLEAPDLGSGAQAQGAPAVASTPPISFEPAPVAESAPAGISLEPLGGGSDEIDIQAVLDAPAGGGGGLELPTAVGANEPSEPSVPTARTGTEAFAVARRPEEDAEAAQEMPYIFDKVAGGARSMAAAFLGMAQPLGDAVVPGGAAQAPDLETLKKYLLLREQDVAALSGQLKSAKEQVAAVEDSLRQARAKNVELGHTVDEQKRKIEEFEREKEIALEGLQNEINELRFQGKSKNDRVRLLEGQVREATDEMERLKERVRADIRKIRVREKELENRLEIMKKDSEALIGARENKIIELKRKLDLLEFNMDLLQDQHSREKEGSARLKERLAKAAQVVRLAGGLLGEGGVAQGPTSGAEADEAGDPVTGERAAS